MLEENLIENTPNKGKAQQKKKFCKRWGKRSSETMYSVESFIARHTHTQASTAAAAFTSFHFLTQWALCAFLGEGSFLLVQFN